MENFDISNVTMSKVYLDKYVVTPHSEQVTYTFTDNGGSRVVYFSDDSDWSLSENDAAVIRNHIFAEPWDGDRVLDAIFYSNSIAAVKIHDSWIPLSGWGYACIYFKMGIEYAKNN